MVLFFLRPWELTTEASFAKTGMTMPKVSESVLYEGEAWKPSVGVDGYALVSENDSYGLYVRPDTTEIAVLDKTSGYRWTSNPSDAELKHENVKGQLLEQLKSPFALTHVRTKGKDQTVRESLSNAVKDMKASMIRQGDGLQISYFFPSKGLGFTVQYELTKAGLKVRVPSKGIKEEGEYALFNLDILPYFGAASSQDDGYLFVPDGPGGLIRYDTAHAKLSRGYIHQVYGSEMTNSGNWTRSGQRRETIAYPVFGLKKNDHAFVAIMTEGEDSANVTALSPGMKSSFFNVFSSQIYREEYLYRMSRLAAPSKAVQQEKLDRDREIEYRFLNDQQANYSGMAATYREYLQEKGTLGKKLEPVAHIPLYLKIMGGNYEQAFGQIRYVAATTFAQAENIVRRLQERGVPSLQTIYFGWTNQGDYNMEKRFPIEEALGGEAGAKSFATHMKERGVGVSFYEDFLWIDSQSSFSPKQDAIRGIDGTAFVDGDWYVAKPIYTAVSAANTISKLKEIGVEGIHYSAIGELLLNDYESSGIRTRDYTKQIYTELLNYTRKELGTAGVFRGNAYVLGASDYIDGLPSESSYDFMVDETVPFYPIVLHGFVPYTFEEGNLRDDEEVEFLKAIEYGALPSFFVTHDDSRKLKNTGANFLYSSSFGKWEDRILKEYENFDALSSLYSQKITLHERLADQRYATMYEDGTRVIVDYSTKSFKVEKGAGTYE
ncbi:DUF5696 domain-containing protein [Paenibacillus sp. NPDC057934]|uniref:DUF5696 domain-containing protein n=1 Tax=Paenibacillus sp. NPDC057934 TaxID=3346282 RepID=UPI0036DF658E